MGVLDALRRWWELNAAVFGKLHRFADVVAGLAFVSMIALGVVVYHAQLGLQLPVSESTRTSLGFAMLAAVGVFMLAVLVQTLAALRAFFARLRIRVLDYVRNQ